MRAYGDAQQCFSILTGLTGDLFYLHFCDYYSEVCSFLLSLCNKKHNVRPAFTHLKHTLHHCVVDYKRCSTTGFPEPLHPAWLDFYIRWTAAFFSSLPSLHSLFSTFGFDELIALDTSCKWITQYFSFHDLFTVCIIMVSRCIHIAECDKISLSGAEYPIFFIRSSLTDTEDGKLMDTVDNAAMNRVVQITCRDLEFDSLINSLDVGFLPHVTVLEWFVCFEEPPFCVQQKPCHFIFLLALYKGSHLPPFSPAVTFRLLFFSFARWS